MLLLFDKLAVRTVPNVSLFIYIAFNITEGTEGGRGRFEPYRYI